MFEQNKYSTKIQPPQSARNKKQIWLCGALAIVSCVIGAWLFAGLLAFCSGANVFFYFRNKKREEEAELIKGAYNDEDDGGFDDDGVELLSKKERKKAAAPMPAAQMSRKERKAKYKQFVKDVEEEFDDFDIDEDDGGDE